MTRSEHFRQKARVLASEHVDRHPDVYKRRPLSEPTIQSAIRVHDALARLESGDEGVREEFIRARVELRVRVKADLEAGR